MYTTYIYTAYLRALRRISLLVALIGVFLCHIYSIIVKLYELISRIWYFILLG